MYAVMLSQVPAMCHGMPAASLLATACLDLLAVSNVESSTMPCYLALAYLEICIAGPQTQMCTCSDKYFCIVLSIQDLSVEDA